MLSKTLFRLAVLLIIHLVSTSGRSFSSTTTTSYDKSTKTSAGSTGTISTTTNYAKSTKASAGSTGSISTTLSHDKSTKASACTNGSSSSSSTTHSYDISKQSDLTKLYNSPVCIAERMKRPLEGWTTTLGPLSHAGVRVTLADGSQWLIHKGDNYGIDSQTVVVDARHMSDKWEVVETKDFNGSKTVSDFVADGGTDYCLFFNNCQHAATRMIEK